MYSGRAYFVDCTTRNFDEIPEELPTNLVSLNLQLNNISKVSSKSLIGCEHLQKLDLSGNGMVFIDPGAFSYTPNLKELHIHDNKLELNSSQSYDMFKPLEQSLEILSIQNNTAYSDRIFENLNFMRKLTMECRSDNDFGKGFLSLTNLSALTIYYKSNKITNDTLVNFTRSPIKEFTIVSDSLEVVEPLSFSHFKYLEILDLSYNQKLTLESASKSWYGLNSTNITTLVLTRMNNSDDQNVRLELDFFNYLENTKISKLLLNKNNIVELAGGFSNHLPFLKHMDFSFNRVTKMFTFVNDIYRFRELSYVDFSYQVRHYLTKRQLTKKNIGKLANSENGITDFESVASKKEEFEKSECEAGVFKTCEVQFSMRSGAQLAKSIDDDDVKRQFGRNTWCMIAARNIEILNLSETIVINFK